MTNGIAFSVAGTPVAKARPRLAPRRVGKRTITVLATPPSTVAFEERVGWAARAAMNGAEPLEGPLAIAIRVRLSPPPSASQRRREAMLAGRLRPTGRPDLDNYCKAVFDGCNRVAYRDDAQIVELRARKFYAPSPGIDVAIKPDDLPEIDPGRSTSDPLPIQF